MKCSQCDKRAVFRIAAAGTSLCKGHFIHHIEKGITQGVRELQIFQHRNVGIAFSGGPKSSSLLNIMKKICEKRKTKLFVMRVKGKDIPSGLRKEAQRKRVGCILTGHCADDFVLRMSSLIMHNRVKELKSISPGDGFWSELKIRHPAPLFRVYESELLRYAELAGFPLNIEKKKGFEKKLSEFIERLEKKHPGTKYKMLKSFLEIRA